MSAVSAVSVVSAVMCADVRTRHWQAANVAGEISGVADKAQRDCEKEFDTLWLVR